MKLKILVVLIFLVCSMLVSPIVAIPGDSVQTAVNATVGLNTGSINVVGGSYYFNFTTALNRIYNYTLASPAGADFDFTIFNPFGGVVQSSSSVAQFESLVTYGVPGTLTIMVTSYVSTGTFNLTIVDMGPIASAIVGPNSGSINVVGGHYSFFFQSIATQEYNMTLTSPPTANFDFMILKTDGSVVLQSNSLNAMESLQVSGYDGELIIDVFSVVGMGSFSLDITQKNNFFTANLGDNFGSILIEGAQANFVFYASINEAYNFTLTSPIAADFDFEISDANGNYVTGSSLGISPESTIVTSLSGNIAINVLSFSGIGNFVLSINTVQVPTAAIGGNSATINHEGGAFAFFFLANTNFDYNFTLTSPSGADFDFDIYDMNGNYVDGSSSGLSPEFVVVTSLSGNITIKIQSYSGTGTFTLNITEIPHPQATVAQIGDNAGTINVDGGQFEFLFDANVSEIYNFTLTSPAGADFDFDVYRADGTYVDGSASGSSPESIMLSSLNGNVTIYINSFYGTGAFIFNIAVQQVNSAVLGSNVGTISSEGGTYVFTFNAAVGQDYRFILVSPPNADFDFVLYDMNKNYLGESYSTSSPESYDLVGYTGMLTIEVSSYTGTGDFVLNIEEINGIQSLTFSNQLSPGVSRSWTVSVDTTNTSAFDFPWGDQSVVDFKVVGNQLTYTWNDIQNMNTLSSFDLAIDGDTSFQDIAILFVAPISVSTTNGSSYGMDYFLSQGRPFFEPTNSITDLGDQIQVNYQLGPDDYFTLNYEKSTGLLVSMFVESYSGADTYKATFSLQVDGGNTNTDTNTNTNTNTNSDTNSTDSSNNSPDISLSGLPLSPYVFIITLLAIPILRKRLNKY